MKNKQFYLTIGGVVLAAAIITFILINKNLNSNAKALPVLGSPGHTVGDFTMVDQTGDTVTQDILNNKVSVVEYFYTTCTGICPRMNDNLSQVYEDLKGLPDFQIISNTVDPATDSVPVLAAYAKKKHANPKNWKFLTGKKKIIFHTAVKEYLLNAADSVGVTGEYVHTNWFALVDRKRRIRGFYDGLKKKSLKKMEADIKQLLNKEKQS